jgi:hypothetical protein
VLTTNFLDRLLEPHYDARDPDDLEDGVTPWLTLSLGVDHHTALRRMANLATVLQGGEQSVTLADVLDLKKMEKDNFAFPHKYRQSFRSLGSFLVVLDTFMGANHRVSQALRQSLKDALLNEEELEERVERSPFGASSVLRWFSLRFNQFFRQHRLSMVATAVALPPFSEIWSDILIENWRAPTLPSRYLSESAASKEHFTDGASTISGLTAPSTVLSTGSNTPTATTKTPSSDKQKAVFHAPDEEVVNMAGENWRSDVVKKELSDTWPVMKSGKLLCLPWWTKKGCFQACKRCHADTLDPGDRKIVLEFLDTNFAKYRKN